MATASSLHFYSDIKFVQGFSPTSQLKSVKSKRLHRLKAYLISSCASRHDVWALEISNRIYRRTFSVSYRFNVFKCPQFTGLIPAVGIIAFAVWGLGPLMRFLRKKFHNDSNWKKSKTYRISTSYLQPLLLWTGTLLICRVLDPVILPSETGQAVKARFVNFVRSLSTVLTFTYCLSSLIEQSQKFFMEACGPDDTRKMGYDFAGKAVYTALWIAAISLFIELLGFSTQKWITAGGLGTVLLTLAGREIFTNFLSSVMIHATRPFILNEWIQTKIDGYEVSGIVEHVGWWSPTIIRGDNREAVHIPNHKFTVNVVRNLSQKTHWRIKTHIAISHLDINKISNIVADMRKVLAKNPLIEQQRLHRRIFFESIDPESQALLILVSCFVKTSHVEEYLGVKEAVLLDLLTVISHHRARLATPIRTVQKIYGDSDIENIPFAETIFRRSAAANRPFLLVDPQSKINTDDKARSRPTSANEEQNSKMDTVAEPKSSDTSEDGSLNKPDKSQQKVANAGDASPNSIKFDSLVAASSSSSSTTQLEDSEPAQSTAKAGGQKPPTPESTEQADVKNEGERVQTKKPQVARTAFGDNIVLGVALEGSKRTLPIDEGMGPSPTQSEANEFAPGRNGSVPATSSKEGKSSAPLVDKRDQDS